MRCLLAARALGAASTAAVASPLWSAPGALDGPAAFHSIHHKPGHKGGPPWTRGRGDDEGSRERVGSRSTCRTTTQTQYDPYRGYVQRQVQVCDTY